MRERRLQASVALCKAGITPARAGKTMLPISTNPLSSDPPRSCGKDCRPFGMLLLPSGSPPLVRERLADLPDDNGMDRITPARAGKTMNSRYVFGQRRDHPRSCGKDSNGFLYFRPFTLTDVQNLFNFFAKHLTSSASPNAR